MKAKYKHLSVCLMFVLVNFGSLTSVLADTPTNIQGRDLAYFSSNNSKDVDELRAWFENVTSKLHLLSRNDSLDVLKNESISNNNWSTFKASVELNKSVDGLTKAECISVSMYTNHSFYGTYNYQIRSGNRKPYEVFTAFLYSALYKLSKIKPIKRGTKLYRGSSSVYNNPIGERIYFKQFTSTSKSYNKSVEYATGNNGTIGQLTTFEITVNITAAEIVNLSFHPEEEEILFSPFISLELVYGNYSRMYFNTSSNQTIPSQITDSGSTALSQKFITFITICLIARYSVY